MILKRLDEYDTFNEFLLEELVFDPATDDWFMMRSVIPTLCIVGLYLIFVVVGPKLMEHREPFQLKSVVIFYDFSTALINLYIVLQVFRTTLRLNYNWICEPKKLITTEDELQLAYFHYIMFFTKIYDFVDTILFILRKKNKQVSVLHVYHHSAMPIFGWVLMKIHPIGNAAFGSMTNGFVHVVMYTYYGLAAMGPHMQKYLWWKKYLTQMQLIQFLYGFIRFVDFNIRGCYNVPNIAFVIFLPYGLGLIGLFVHFYITTYQNAKIAIDKKSK